MASSALDKMEEQITCSVCFEQYNSISKTPKVLLCHHVCCKDCLASLLQKTRQGDPAQPTISCPTCRKETPVSKEGGVSALETAFHVNQLIDIFHSLSAEGGAGGSSEPSSFSSGATTGYSETSVGASSTSGAFPALIVPEMGPKPMCPDHKHNELQLYCETCDKVICYQCTNHEHKDHGYRPAKDAVAMHKVAITIQWAVAMGLAAQVEQVLPLVDARKDEVSDRRAALEVDVHRVIQALHETAIEQETVLVKQLDSVANKKLKSLEAEKDVKETVHAQLTACTRYVKDTLDNKTDVEILLQKKKLMRKLQETIQRFKDEPDILIVKTEADILFSVPSDLAPRCGHILTPDSLDPQKCSVRGNNLEAAEMEEKAFVFLKVCDYKGMPYVDTIPGESLECKLVSLRAGETRRCDVKRMNSNVHEISYIATHRGAHELNVKVEGVHVRGSPFLVTVRTAIQKLGTPIAIFRDMVQPWGIAVNRREELVVTECNRHRITIFASNGKRIRSMASHGSEPGQVRYPCGVTLDEQGNIFVVDVQNYRVQKFTEFGQLLGVAGGVKGNGSNQFFDPKGLTFNLVNSKVYVGDTQRVQVLDANNLAFSGPFGKFSNAFGVACDSKGNVYVSDDVQKSVQIFTAEGRFLRVFVSKATRVLGPNLRGGGWTGIAPVALAIDGCGLVYMSDKRKHCVSVFSPEGICLKTFGKEGVGSGEFKMPHGIAATARGVVYVCDYLNDRVQVF